jgi:hypothetical protein
MRRLELTEFQDVRAAAPGQTELLKASIVGSILISLFYW